MKLTAWIYSLATATFGAGILSVLALDSVATEPSASKERAITLAEIAQHAHPNDCWMAIDTHVYDLSAYIPQHPTPAAIITDWCGKEASEAYHTKGRGRPHSAYADGLLPQYRIGRLKK